MLFLHFVPTSNSHYFNQYLKLNMCFELLASKSHLSNFVLIENWHDHDDLIVLKMLFTTYILCT